MKPLTAKQLVALVESSTVDGLNPWMHGSTTISELKKRGLVERCQDSKGTVYRITEDGLEELRR